VSFPLPPIADAALQKFCAKHNLYEAIAAGYHYAQKFFLTDQIQIDFYPPYREDEPEEAAIDFVIETSMTSNEVFNALDEFNKTLIQIPGTEYICLSPRFTAHEPS
jgi:hypothetical protein